MLSDPHRTLLPALVASALALGLAIALVNP